MIQLPLCQLLVLNSLFCIGVYVILSEGYLLRPISEFIEGLIPYWMTKPLFNCPPCMASFWGSIFYLTNYPYSWHIVPYLFTLAGLNAILSKIINHE